MNAILPYIHTYVLYVVLCTYVCMYAGNTHTHLLLLPEHVTKLQLALYQRYTYVHTCIVKQISNVYAKQSGLHVCVLMHE